MKVLVVDDEADIRRIARLALSRVGGMEVAESEGGSTAVARALEERPDAILLDVMMPGIDGPSVLRALQEQPATAAIPVIFLTAKAMPAEIAFLKSLGATGVLAKPFDPMSLAASVRQMLTP
jgi:two-component system, OmpR family, response regulator